MDQLARVHAEVPRKTIEADVERMAADLGISQQAMIQRLIREANEAGFHQGRAATNSSGDGDPKVTLWGARAKSDIFWYNSATDHVGAYSGRAYIVEAPGINKVSREMAAKNRRVPTSAEKYKVVRKNDYSKRIPLVKRTGVSKFLRAKLGKPYRNKFYDNKYINARKYNCSQLVWAGFMSRYNKTWRIGLDANGGSGVYPWDIRNHQRTVRYKRIT